jgi:hypothetical protein
MSEGHIFKRGIFLTAEYLRKEDNLKRCYTALNFPIGWYWTGLPQSRVIVILLCNMMAYFCMMILIVML